jgi:hypothetical protein
LAQTVRQVSTSTATPSRDPAAGVPHWPATVALVLVGILLTFLSNQLTLGPSWLPLAIVAILIVPITIARRRNLHAWRRRLGMIGLGTVTGALAASVILLVYLLARSELQAKSLLVGGASIWAANLLTFSVWYWEIDGGGPAKRRRDGHVSSDFLFPQLQVGDGKSSGGWWPGFLDYMFVAFNASTAFSPTDTLILSQRAKILMMIQATISFVAVIIIAARAINTLT